MMTSVEEDGDEIFTPVSDGCYRCRQPEKPAPLVKQKL